MARCLPIDRQEEAIIKKTDTVMIKIEGLSKFFRTEEVETIALNGVDRKSVV